MRNAEKFFRDKSFPAGISDEEFKKWRYSHKGINWQQFSIEAMEEYARLKSQEENKELVEAIKKIDLEWTRQKSLFPELHRDGWMDLEINKALIAAQKHTPKG